MSFDPQILKSVLSDYDQRRRTRESEYRARREQVFALLPRAREIDRELRGTAAQVVRTALSSGRDPVAAVESLKEHSRALREECAALLVRHGFPADYLDERPLCPKCSDTGYLGAQPCECLLRAYGAEQKRRLSQVLDLEGQSFENFDFSLYDDLSAVGGMTPRENIRRVYDFCVDYCKSFSPASPNLFLTGRTGVGKTYLSGCIAQEVGARGFSVVYETAIRLFSAFEAERFEHSPEAGAQTRRYLSCDLLILDDLGTEFSSPFTVSALYSVINSRLHGRTKTVISSNLTVGELHERYSPQICSRIEGEYIPLYLYGEDLRLKGR